MSSSSRANSAERLPSLGMGPVATRRRLQSFQTSSRSRGAAADHRLCWERLVPHQRFFKSSSLRTTSRFIIADRPGIIAALAEVFSRHGINVDSVLQEPGWSKEELPFVVTLEACSSVAVNEALNESALFDFHVRPPLWLPVLT